MRWLGSFASGCRNPAIVIHCGSVVLARSEGAGDSVITRQLLPLRADPCKVSSAVQSASASHRLTALLGLIRVMRKGQHTIDHWYAPVGEVPLHPFKRPEVVSSEQTAQAERRRAQKDALESAPRRPKYMGSCLVTRDSS